MTAERTISFNQLFNLLLRGGGTDAHKRLYWAKYADPIEKRLNKPLWGMTTEEFEEYKVLDENLKQGNLEGGNCKLCKNRGYTVQFDGIYTTHVPCFCIEQRNQKREIQNSGFADLMTSHTFEKFIISEEWQKNALRAVKAWTNQKQYPFLYLGGKTGAGKTHLAAASFYSLIQRGVRGKYISWREQSRELKMRMTDIGYYDDKIRELKTVPLLLIDDLLWTNGSFPTDEDFKLAKEIIEARQINGRRTIITTNWTIKEMNELSEVVGGRIYEGCGSKTNFALTFGAETRNYRAKTQPTLLPIEGISSPFDE